MKIAFVYDRVTKWGGAERVLLALHEIWPEAPLYTAVYDKKAAPWADVFDIHTSFLQKIPFANKAHELFPWLTPLAFESFNFDTYDIVISITSAEAKSIITKPGTIHICYCLTPTRYLWSGFDQYKHQSFFGKILNLCAPILQRWDLVSASRPDVFIAISNRVKDRIEKYYHRTVEAVIYPPVGFMSQVSRIKYHGEDQTTQSTPQGPGYFLTVSRLVGYKRVDVIIEVFNKLGLPLIIIGDGRQKALLKGMAKKNITFIDKHLTDSDLVGYYEHCRAFVYAADEDFGIAAVEAQLFGKPVIAYKESGLAETVVDKKTGILYSEQSPEGLIRAIKQSQTMSINPGIIRENAQQFSNDVFMSRIQAIVKKIAHKKS
jgi:glycosyltransferase involved in cell wall biosynthesis